MDELTYTIEYWHRPRIIRDRGDSIIAFPDSYVVIDTETTGLDPLFDEIIELAAIKYEKGQEVGRFSALVQPTAYDYDESISEDYCVLDDKKIVFVDSFITNLTGITNAMLLDARKPEEVLPEYLSFIGDSIVVGHNVSFDINFIYDATEKLLNKKFSNNYIDTRRIARKLLKSELTHFRVKDLVKYYHISQPTAHRALADCETTNECFLRMRQQVAEQYEEETAFIELFGQKHSHRSLSLRDIVPTNNEIDEDSPIFGKVFVFTGALDRMLRKDAAQLVVNKGGICGDNITKKTNYLVLGCNDYCSTIKDGKSTKQKKAEQLKLAGNDIEIISENVFYEMLEEE